MMKPIAALVFVTAVASPALADDDQYKQIDKARAAIIPALDTGDATTLAAFVGSDLSLTDVWFDSASCRKRFATAHVKAKDVAALAACFKGLDVHAQGMLVTYGPGVITTLEVRIVDRKPVLLSISGQPANDPALPQVWRDAFESHRKAGSPEVALDAAARAELGKSGAAYEVCVDGHGLVISTDAVEVDPDSATARQLKAATKTWRFEPFMLRGKPTTVCTTSITHPVRAP